MSGNTAKGLLEQPGFVEDLRNETLSGRAIAEKWGCSESTARQHRINLKKGGSGRHAATDDIPKTESEQHDSDDNIVSAVKFSNTAWGFEDYRKFIRSQGQDPDTVTFTWGWTSNPTGGFWNKLNNVRPIVDKGAESGPEWPVVQQAPLFLIAPRVRVEKPARDDRYRLGLKCGDAQIGFRRLADGSLQPFHDEQAMALFIEVAHIYQPDTIHVLGDFLDLASQGRFAQEAAFAQTTQLAINSGSQWLTELRAACPNARIVILEGNHEKRMQNFIEANALSAFGLKRANMPESWPVMSLPYLLRLDELDIQYVDAYPAATDWDNDLTRNIHGTKANSKGSTMSQYVHELPHVNTWAGHTHRAEVVYRSVLGARGVPVESYAANPGVLCRTDGAVPSVNGAIGASGDSATVVEDWQQGLGFHWFNETESIPQVYRIRNGSVLIDGRLISV